MTTTQASNEEIPKAQLTKKQRGRWKKLRKRSMEEKTGCDTSGITSLLDRWELEQLGGDDTTATPGVRLRNPNNKKNELQNSEGSDHRGILFSLFSLRQMMKKNQKRKRHDPFITTQIPSWATLHNVACFDQLTVLEIHISSYYYSFDALEEHLPILKTIRRNDTSKQAALEAKTRWFQGPRPCSITSSLLYCPLQENDGDEENLIDSKTNSTKQQKTTSRPTTTPEVIAALKRHSLTTEELQKEGFPLVCDNENAERKPQLQHVTFSDDKNNTYRNDDKDNKDNNKLKIPSLEEAKLLIQKYHVHAVVTPNNNNNRKTDSNQEVLESDKQKRYVSTPTNEKKLASTRVFAMDCEMVQTRNGRELARVTMVQLIQVQPFEYVTILDELVLPDSPVLDYLTGML